MKANTTRMGLSIITSGLAFVGAANAMDLIVNGSFEDPQGAEWVGFYQTYNFTQAYFTGPPIPSSENPGLNYSWNHGVASGDYSGPCTQTVNLTTAVTPQDIDTGMAQFTFSAWLASYGNPGSNPDQPYLTLQFFDGSNTPVGTTFIFDRVTSTSFTKFADGVTVFDSTTHLHDWAKYVRTASIPQGARMATVGITHSPGPGFSGRPDTYTDLVKLDVVSTSVPVPPSVDSASPADSASGVRPDAIVNVTLRDGTSAVDTNRIQFSFDGLPVIPSIQKDGAITTIQYDPPGLLEPLSAHVYRIVFSDNRVPATTQTNVFAFTVARYYNILLPTPIVLETFDSTAEGTLPAGWNSVSMSGQADTLCDPSSPDIGGLQDLHSACYTNWVTVNSQRFKSPMLGYANHDPSTDYQRVLDTNHINVVNGALVTNLAQGNIVFGNSGYQDGAGSQILYLFSPDFDLTGHQNVYLSFHSLWEQNQDSIGAVEYSIDQGATWLPILYMLDGPDILRNASGNIDAVATLTNIYTGFEGPATYFDPVDMQIKGGFYGAFIGVASNEWANLGPYFSARLNDNPSDSKRVEVFRLPAADNQSKVRLRFAHAGTDSWYFGLDDIGLYSIGTVGPPALALTPTNVVEAVGNTVVVASDVVGIGPFAYQWKHNGVDVPNQTNSTLVLIDIQPVDAGTYTLQVGFPGGSTNSSGSVLTVIQPTSLVIGQWDFVNLDLRATCGRALEFFDAAAAADSLFGDTDFLVVSNIAGQSVNIMRFIPTAPFGGYKMFPGVPGNGGGTNLNQYTLIMDILYPGESQNVRRALLQTNPDNADDADFRIDENNGIGVNGVYNGIFQADTWQRVALAVDLTGPGPNPIVAKFIDGVKVGQQTLTEGRDGRWSLSSATDPDKPYALLFADAALGVAPGYVSSIQLRSGRLSDAAIARLGGPTAQKIAGCITSSSEGGHLIIRWTGGMPLQSADNITGPWSDVANAISPYTVPTPLAGKKFYRPKL